MPSFGDSIFIFVLALILFGPKKLPEIARWMGKLMAEFRRASNEFRIQMEDELRMAEQAETQKKFAAQSAPETPALSEGQTIEATATTENTIAARVVPDVTPDDHYADNNVTEDHLMGEGHLDTAHYTVSEPIATAGEISIHPPATGLPLPAKSEAELTTAETATHD